MTRFFIASVMVLWLILPVNKAFARELVRHKSLTAHVEETYQCSEKIKLSVNAPDSSYFTGDKVDFQRIVASARAVLSFECANIESLLVRGQVAGEHVYTGVTTASGNWVVVDVSTSGGATVKKSAPVNDQNDLLPVSAEENKKPHSAEQNLNMG